MSWDIEDILEVGRAIAAGVGILVLLGLLLLGGYAGWQEIGDATACLRFGYPDSKVTYRLEVYCVRRVNQTDEVVPLASLEGRRPR